MSQFEPDDLFVVNRNNTSYNVPFVILQENLGGGGGNGIQPQPTQVFASPNFIGGNGSETSPYVITPAESFLNGVSNSEQEITLIDQEGSTSAFFEDLNAADNGIRFNQPPMSTSTNGALVFKLLFSDIPESPQDQPVYTGLIKLGKTYFTWDVTVLNRGVTKPTINTVTGISGVAVNPPRYPAFTSAPSPVIKVEFTAEYTGLFANISQIMQVSGGSGQNLDVEIKTSAVGKLLEPVINSPGTDYFNGDNGFIDLTSIGGAAVSCNIYTEPLVGGNFIVDISAYETVFGGDFAKSEWLFSSSPTFDAGDETTYENTDPSVSLVIPNNRPDSSVNFMKVRNVSIDGIESPYSDAVQFVTAKLVLINYDLTDWNVGPKSFNSGDFQIIVESGAALTINGKDSDLNPDGTTTGGQGTNDGGGACCVGSPGNAAQVQVLVQVRQDVSFKVLTIDGSGGVNSVEQVKKGHGSQDRYMDQTKTIVPPITGGTGNGCEILIKRDLSDNQTIFRSIKTAGTGYTIGDILEISLDYGTGNANVQDLDSVWDVMLNGLGGSGGRGANGEGNTSTGGNAGNVQWYGSEPGAWGGNAPDGRVGGRGGDAGSATGSLYSAKGSNGSNNVTTSGGGGGGGGNGWASGGGGGGGQDGGSNKASAGGGGGSGYSYHNPILTNYSTNNTTYGQQGYQVSLNNELVETNDATELRIISLS